MEVLLFLILANIKNYGRNLTLLSTALWSMRITLRKPQRLILNACMFSWLAWILIWIGSWSCSCYHTTSKPTYCLCYGLCWVLLSRGHAWWDTKWGSCYGNWKNYFLSDSKKVFISVPIVMTFHEVDKCFKFMVIPIGFQRVRQHLPCLLLLRQRAQVRGKLSHHCRICYQDRYD